MSRSPIQRCCTVFSLVALNWHPAFCGEIHDAATAENLARVKALLALGANVNAKDNQGERPLHGAVVNNQKDVVEWLLTHKAELMPLTTMAIPPALRGEISTRRTGDYSWGP